MRPNRLTPIALMFAITLLPGCGGSSGPNSGTVVATFKATDTATVTADASSYNGFAFLGAAAVSGVPSTVTLGLNPSGLPLNAAVSGVVAITATSLTSGPTGYSGNTPFSLSTTGTTNFSGDLFATTVPATTINTATGLKYSNFGEWQLLPPPGTTPGTFYLQEYAGGTQLMAASGVPSTSNYSGTVTAIGFDNSVNPPNEYVLSTGGTAVSLDFSSSTGQINYIPGTRNRWTGAVSGPFDTLTISGLTISGNTFSGTFTTNGDAPTGPFAFTSGIPGTLSGKFYGPAGNEVTGVYQLISGNAIIIGSFGAKQ